jgi:hypothetical protein
MFVNEDAETYTGNIKVPKKGNCYIYDAWNNQIMDIQAGETSDGSVFEVVIEPLKPLIVVFDETDQKKAAAINMTEKKRDFNQGWKRSLCRSIDYPHFTEDKPVSFPDSLAAEKPLFSGFVRYDNTVDCKPGEHLYLEISKAAEGIEVFVNENSAGIQIASPYCYDLSPWVREGVNDIRIEVATTLEREMSEIPNPMAELTGEKSSPSSESGITGEVFYETRKI